MLKSTFVLAIVMLVVATTSPNARCGFNVVAGDFVKLRDGPGSPGGVFHIDVVGRGTTTDFDTYCVELTEHVSLSKTYYVESVGLVTKQGNRQLGAQAAWLYTQFLDQNTLSLAGFNFNLVNMPSINPTLAKKQSDALQLGIWRGMLDQFNNPYTDMDIKNLSGWSLSYINTLTTTYLDLTDNTGWLNKFQSDATWSGTGNVRIMNLRAYKYKANGDLVLTDYAQDQLVSIVPELSSFYSVCTAVSCVVLFGLFTLVQKHLRASVAA